MSEIRKLIKQSSHYLYSNLFSMVLHLISFPILTRVLTISDYGILGLINVTIMLITTFCKAGLQNSIVRFYEEYKKNELVGVFYSTFFFGSFIISFIVIILYILLVFLFKEKIVDREIINLLFFIISLILLKGIRFLIMSFWRAEQKTKLYSIITIFSLFLPLFLGLILLFVISNKILYFLFGNLIGELISFLIVIILVYKEHNKEIKISLYSKKLFKESLLYGLPLMEHEFTNYILVYFDRYAIALLMTNYFLGLYSAGSNLSNSIAAVLTTPLSFAVAPIYMQIWTNKGKEETQKFLSSTLKYSCLIALPIIFGTIAVSRNLISFLASEKYINAHSVIPYLITGSILFGLVNILNAGLLINKKSYIVMLITTSAGLLNIILNMILIKMKGIEGAAIATFISYVFLILLNVILSFRYLSFKINYNDIFRYLIYSIIMYLVVISTNLNKLFLSLFLKIFIGILIYIGLILIFEKEIKNKIFYYIGVKNV